MGSKLGAFIYMHVPGFPLIVPVMKTYVQLFWVSLNCPCNEDLHVCAMFSGSWLCGACIPANHPGIPSIVP